MVRIKDLLFSYSPQKIITKKVNQRLMYDIAGNAISLFLGFFFMLFSEELKKPNWRFLFLGFRKQRKNNSIVSNRHWKRYMVSPVMSNIINQNASNHWVLHLSLAESDPLFLNSYSNSCWRSNHNRCGTSFSFLTLDSITSKGNFQKISELLLAQHFHSFSAISSS